MNKKDYAILINDNTANSSTKPTIVIPIILYIVLYILTTIAARSPKVIMIGRGALPIAATAGAISALSSVCLVFLVLQYKKTGFIIAVAAIIISMLSLLRWIIVQGNVGSLTGLATTKGMLIGENMILSFHTMSYPTARLVWHCPFFCIFSSSNGEVDGQSYREYLLLKMDGESFASDEKVENVVNVEHTEDFEGWKNWNEKNRQGMDCIVKLRREGNKVILQTENLGIRINSSSTLQDSPKDLYIALTGDQCAITNINMSNA